MNIKVNIAILNRRMGDIVKEGDPNYDTFKGWAENGNKRLGIVIGEFVKSKGEAAPKVPATEENEKRKIALIECPHCNKFKTESSSALESHIFQQHPKIRTMPGPKTENVNKEKNKESKEKEGDGK